MDLFYREAGEDGQQALIILHGLFGSSDNWLTLARHIAEQGFKVYLTDARNHGRSPHTDEISYQSMADDLAGFIQKNQIEKPIVIGHSMGGKTVMEFAARYPELYQKLVVVDIAPKQYPLHHQEILAGLNDLNLDEIKSRGEADKGFSAYVKENDTRQFLLKNLYRDEDKKFAWRFNLKLLTETIASMGSPVPVTGTKVDAETLFIRGAKSKYVKDEDFDNIKNIFTKAEIETIADAGHWVHAEQPQAFLQSLLNFVK